MILFDVLSKLPYEKALERIDRHIYMDTDLEPADYGKFKEHHKGVHMERKGRRLSGIFRLNNWAENDYSRFRKMSVHIYFCIWVFKRKNGTVGFFGFTLQKITQLFVTAGLALLTFLFSYKQDLTETGVFAYTFGMMLVYLIIEFIGHTLKLAKELRSIFSKDI